MSLMKLIPEEIEIIIIKYAQEMNMLSINEDIKNLVCGNCCAVHDVAELYHCDDCDISFCDMNDPDHIYCPNCFGLFYFNPEYSNREGDDYYNCVSDEDIENEIIYGESYYDYNEMMSVF